MFDAAHVVCQARPRLVSRKQIVAFRPLTYYLVDSSFRHNGRMGKHLLRNLVYLGALSLLVFVFTLVILFAAATLLLPSTTGFAFGVSTRSFTIAVVGFFTAVAVAVFFVARALQRRRLN
jgi:hypothetical protein